MHRTTLEARRADGWQSSDGYLSEQANQNFNNTTDPGVSEIGQEFDRGEELAADAEWEAFEDGIDEAEASDRDAPPESAAPPPLWLGFARRLLHWH